MASSISSQTSSLQKQQQQQSSQLLQNTMASSVITETSAAATQMTPSSSIDSTDTSSSDDKDLLLDSDPYLSSSPSIHEDEIDFHYVYALRTFVATERGQANASKGDAMILLNDSNSYWWLVRLVKDSSVGFLPAEHIETPSERLARLNKHRNSEYCTTAPYSLAGANNSLSLPMGNNHMNNSSTGSIASAGSTSASPAPATHSASSSPLSFFHNRLLKKTSSSSLSKTKKSVTFTQNLTYVSASEYEYSDADEADVEDMAEDSSDEEEQEEHHHDKEQQTAQAQQPNTGVLVQGGAPVINSTSANLKTDDDLKTTTEPATLAAANNSHLETPASAPISAAGQALGSASPLTNSFNVDPLQIRKPRSNPNLREGAEENINTQHQFNTNSDEDDDVIRHSIANRDSVLIHEQHATVVEYHGDSSSDSSSDSDRYPRNEETPHAALIDNPASTAPVDNGNIKPSSSDKAAPSGLFSRLSRGINRRHSTATQPEDSEVLNATSTVSQDGSPGSQPNPASSPRSARRRSLLKTKSSTEQLNKKNGSLDSSTGSVHSFSGLFKRNRKNSLSSGSVHSSTPSSEFGSSTNSTAPPMSPPSSLSSASSSNTAQHIVLQPIQAASPEVAPALVPAPLSNSASLLRNSSPQSSSSVSTAIADPSPLNSMNSQPPAQETAPAAPAPITIPVQTEMAPVQQRRSSFNPFRASTNIDSPTVASTPISSSPLIEQPSTFYGNSTAPLNIAALAANDHLKNTASVVAPFGNGLTTTMSSSTYSSSISSTSSSISPNNSRAGAFPQQFAGIVTAKSSSAMSLSSGDDRDTETEMETGRSGSAATTMSTMSTVPSSPSFDEAGEDGLPNSHDKFVKQQSPLTTVSPISNDNTLSNLGDALNQQGSTNSVTSRDITAGGDDLTKPVPPPSQMFQSPVVSTPPATPPIESISKTSLVSALSMPESMAQTSPQFMRPMAPLSPKPSSEAPLYTPQTQSTNNAITAAVAEAGSFELHPEILPMYQETSAKLDKISARIDELLKTVSRRVPAL